MAPTLRRWSYSLRTLFVMVTICAIVSPAVPVLVAKYNQWRWNLAFGDVGSPGLLNLHLETHCVFSGDSDDEECPQERPTDS